jgi:hypothetical protein
VILWPERGTDHEVTGVEVEQRIMLGKPRQTLSFVAPIRFVGMVPLAETVTGMPVSDEDGVVDVQTTDYTMPDHSLGRRWTRTRAVSGLITARYRLVVAVRSPLHLGVRFDPVRKT